MTVSRDDVQQLAPLEMVEMFVWDDRPIGGTTVFRWHPGTTETGSPITWQGVTYEPFPIEIEGLEVSAVGKLPRPTVRAANTGGVLGAYLRSMSDALNAKLTRKRVFGKYLDAVNFPGGNPYANPSAGFPDEIFYVAKKVSENPIFVEIELAVRFDVDGVMLPRRQVLADICQWAYRSAECSYAGPPVEDIYGNPTTDATKDQCRKTLDACRARFGQKGVLRTSAFPASLLMRT
ncbi:phage minor tail protein L [Ensifer sp. IC3342]|nr:phage minor tail protein L [Ensifer sp. BRP08]MCA1446936.1 phage minor tail protein L [Ensifer sp. IC3342]